MIFNLRQLCQHYKHGGKFSGLLDFADIILPVVIIAHLVWTAILPPFPSDALKRALK